MPSSLGSKIQSADEKGAETSVASMGSIHIGGELLRASFLTSGGSMARGSCLRVPITSSGTNQFNQSFRSGARGCGILARQELAISLKVAREIRAFAIQRAP